MRNVVLARVLANKSQYEDVVGAKILQIVLIDRLFFCVHVQVFANKTLRVARQQNSVLNNVDHSQHKKHNRPDGGYEIHFLDVDVYGQGALHPVSLLVI